MLNVVANISRIPKVNEALISNKILYEVCHVYLAMTLKIPNNNVDSRGHFYVRDCCALISKLYMSVTIVFI